MHALDDRPRPSHIQDFDTDSDRDHGLNDPQAEDHDLSDMLQEIRILQQGIQVLTAFLIVVPFSEGFGRLDQIEKWVYLTTFVSAIAGLVFISAPAAQHRIARPLRDKAAFKRFATRMALIGLGTFSVSLTLAVQLVSNEVVGFGPSIVVAAVMAMLIGVVWWLVPLLKKQIR